MSKIKLAPKVEFPAAELATEVTAAIGIRGSGKSNALAVIAEGLLERAIQVVVLDPVGLWFSLRLAADGKTWSGAQIAVLGGRHGEIPLLPTAGRLVATALATTGRSAVLDVSGFSKADRCRFAADFAEQLLRDKKDHQGPLWLLVEESQQFMPQVIRHGLEYMGRMLGAFEEMAEVGRNFGLGLGLATQRPQKVNKEVLNLAENVLAFRLLGVLERKAIKEWVQEQSAPGRDAVDGELPGLVQGEALVWSPVRGIYGRVLTPKKQTYDAGATPLAAREKVRVGALDLGALEVAMAAVVEEVQANDPKKLRAEIARLNAQVKRLNDEAALEVEIRREVVEVYPGAAVAVVRRARGMVEKTCDELRQNVETLARRAAEMRESEEAWERDRASAYQGGPAPATPLPPSPGAKASPGGVGAAGGPVYEAADPVTRPARRGAAVERWHEEEQRLEALSKQRGRIMGEGARAAVAHIDAAIALSPAARAMLGAFGATRLPGLTWRQAATLARRKARGGAFERDKRALLVGGLVEEVKGTYGGYAITGVGRELVPAPIFHSAEDLMHLWQDKLPQKAWEMLRYIRSWNHDIASLTWDAVAEGVGLKSKNNGNFARYQTLLRANGLVVEDGGAIQVVEELR